MILGTLGRLTWHRCRACGTDYGTMSGLPVSTYATPTVETACPACGEEEEDTNGSDPNQA